MRYLFPLLLALPAVAAEPVLETQVLFKAGTAGYATYRIPGLVVTDKGTLLAYCEARKTASDWGAIDVLYRRSVDGGTTWSDPKKVVDIGGGFEKNPVAVNRKLGHFPEITVHNPVAIAGPGVVHFLYCVEYLRCFYTRSEDDGKTFSPPVEITPAFEAFRPRYDWKVLATGPGHGVRLKSGRLVVPVWLSTGEGGGGHRPSAVATIVSDDGGKTWKAGDIVARHPGLINPSEAAVVELPDGRVMLNIRHESTTNRRAVSISADGATKWSTPVFDPALAGPVCMASLARWGDRLLFANPHNTHGRERKNVSVQASDDGGKTWTYRRAIESGLSGYSDLAVRPDGWAYCFYERGGVAGNAFHTRALVLAKFNEAWLTTKPLRVLCLGDSITKGYRPGVTDEQAFPALVEAALRKDGVAAEVLNAGVGGETTVQARRRLKAAVIDQHPAVVTVMYGANDSYIDPGKTAPRVPLDEYRQNLTAIVRDLKAAGIRPILMTTNRYGDQHPPDGSGKNPNVQMEAYMAVCRAVAAAEGVPLVDHQQHWIDAAKAGTDLETWLTDHLHPNPRGHEEIARLLLPVVRKAAK